MAAVKSNLAKFYVYSFLSAFTLFSGVLIPFYTQWGKIDQFHIQILQAWFMLWVFILEIPTGAVADYFGRKFSIALGAACFAVGSVIYASQPTFIVFLIGEFILANAIALASGADEALLVDTLKSLGREHEVKKTLGRARSLELLAIGLSAPLGSFVAQKFGLNFPMLLTAIPMGLAAILAMAFTDPVKSGISESKRYAQIIKDGVNYARHHKVLRILVIDGVVVASSGYFVIWLYQRLLQQIGVAVLWFGVFHLILTLVQILVNNTFHLQEKIFGSISNYLKISALFAGVGFILVGIHVNIITIMLFILLSGGYGLTRLTHLSSHMNRVIDSEYRATVLSSLSMFRRMFLVILNPLVGFFADKSLSLTLIALGILPLLVVLFSPIRESMLSESTAS